METEFVSRMLADAPSPTSVDDVVQAVGHLEQAFAAIGAFGLIHARVGMLAVAEDRRMIVRDSAAPGVLRTPSGHRWVFGGGYATPLGDKLIGTTSATYGWRGEVVVREAIQHQRNQFVAIAKRSVIVGDEALIGAAEITGDHREIASAASRGLRPERLSQLPAGSSGGGSSWWRRTGCEPHRHHHDAQIHRNDDEHQEQRTMTKSSRLTDAEMQRIATAFHEAGHAAASVLAGGRVARAVINDGNPRTEFVSIPAGRETEVSYAGPWAEAWWLAGHTPGPADIRRVLAANRSDDRALCAAGGPHLEATVVPLLDRCWPAVKAVTSKLFHHGQVDHADVCAALGLTDDGGPGSLELAMIRSGSVPGSFHRDAGCGVARQSASGDSSIFFDCWPLLPGEPGSTPQRSAGGQCVDQPTRWDAEFKQEVDDYNSGRYLGDRVHENDITA